MMAGEKEHGIKGETPRRSGMAVIVMAVALPCLSLLLYGAAFAAVGKIEVNGLHSIEDGELLNMLGLSSGSPVSKEMVREGIKRAFLKGIFEDIAVTVGDGEPQVVTVSVREKEFIQKISLRGDYDVSGRLIKKLLVLKEGDVMRYDRIAEATEILGNGLLYRGFPDARITIGTEKSAKPYRVILAVSVDTGEPLIVKHVRITGTDLVSADDVRISRGDVYDQEKLAEDMIRLRGMLKKKGFYKPSVGPHTYRDGDLEIAVSPGNSLTVLLSGNSAFSDSVIHKEIPFFEIEDFSDEIVDEAVSRILAIYHNEGYAFAQVAPVITSEGGAITISFFIFEGERIKTKTIQFIGSSLPLQSIRNVLELKENEKYNPALLDRDRERLKEFYGALGYLDANVKEFEVKIVEEEQAAYVTVSVHEGERTVLSSIEIAGVEQAMKERLLPVVNMKVGDPYNEVDISDARFRMLDFFTGLGYANFDVIVERSIENYRAALVFRIREGRRVTIGKTVVAGNRETKYVVIQRELQYREGQAYNIKTLGESRQRLHKIGLFTDVEIEPVDTGGDVRDLLVRVKEGNAGSVEFGIGYADYEQFRGFAEVSYKNLMGMNRQGMARVELSSLEQRLVLQYLEPWFMGYPVPSRTIFLYQDRKEVTFPERSVLYRVERYSVSSGTEKKLSSAVKLEAYYEYSRVNTTDVKPDVVLTKEDVGTLGISSIRSSIVFDSRDNPFDPSKGIVAGASCKVASSLLLSETDFVKFTAYASIFHRLNKRMVLALSARGGAAYGFGDTEELPLVERFFLGGGSSVRGYDQDTLGPKGSNGDPTGGNAFGMGSVEVRTSIGRGFGLVPFVDFGNVWLKSYEADLFDLKYTVGLGLRYSTPVGPLRVDYGYKLNREKGESAGEIHFSIGNAF
jgi:outer membrane protein insertion porin family